MNALRLLPAVLALLLLAAHFYRAGLVALAVAACLLPLALLVKKPWIPRLFQVVLVAAALEWCRTLYVIAQMRIAFDMPWARMALILGAVAAFSALAALLFETRGLRRRYSADRPDSRADAGAR